MRPPLAIVLSAALLAGCTAVPDPTGPPAAGSAPQVLPWGIIDCTFLIGLVRFDPAQAQDLLPPGFAFRTGSGLPLPVDVAPLDQATLGVEAFSCASGAGLQGSVAPLAYGSVYFTVDPPPELSAGEDVPHFLKLSVLVPDADRRAALEAVGADVTDGAVDLAAGPAGATGTLALATVGDFAFAAVPTRPPGEGAEFRFREFTPTADGRLVRWDGHAVSSATYGGQGLLEVPAGSIPARLGGGTTLQVGMFGGQYTFEDATITLPP